MSTLRPKVTSTSVAGAAVGGPGSSEVEYVITNLKREKQALEQAVKEAWAYTRHFSASREHFLWGTSNGFCDKHGLG
jgi:hypothetical protein